MKDKKNNPFGFRYYRLDSRGHLKGSNNKLVWGDLGHPVDMCFYPDNIGPEEWNQFVEEFLDILDEDG